MLHLLSLVPSVWIIQHTVRPSTRVRTSWPIVDGTEKTSQLPCICSHTCVRTHTHTHAQNSQRPCLSLCLLGDRVFFILPSLKPQKSLDPQEHFPSGSQTCTLISEINKSPGTHLHLYSSGVSWKKYPGYLWTALAAIMILNPLPSWELLEGVGLWTGVAFGQEWPSKCATLEPCLPTPLPSFSLYLLPTHFPFDVTQLNPIITLSGGEHSRILELSGGPA